jgi:MoaA/NifB/PqqE/SkfB family radical SAM enzyme
MSRKKFFLRKQINLDIHNKCTLECSQCARKSILKRPNITLANFPGCPLTNSDWKKILAHYTRINFCGQIADPIMHPKLSNFLSDMYIENKVGNVHTAVSHKPMKYFLKAFKANPNMQWYFGIDGLPKDSHKYRINQDGEKLFKIMLESRKYLNRKPVWQYIVFKYNENNMDEAKTLAKEIHVDLLFIYSGRYWKDDPLMPSPEFRVRREEYE